MKYQRGDEWFAIGHGKDLKIVQPFDGEPVNEGPSWSQGFTHFREMNGNVDFCGIFWFEKNARPV